MIEIYMQESGRHFKGKIMSKLMTYGAGMRNDARAFFKNVQVPLAAGTGYVIVISVSYGGFVFSIRIHRRFMASHCKIQLEIPPYVHVDSSISQSPAICSRFLQKCKLQSTKDMRVIVKWCRLRYQ